MGCALSFTLMSVCLVISMT